MSCVKPLTAYQKSTGGPPVFTRPRPKEKAFFKKVKLPCRQCIGCRIDNQADWCARLLNEAQTHETSLFVTLTYDQENVPRDFGLHHEDFQLFMKRVRKKFPALKIRYFMCGEYGTNGSRPHFHAIIFGLEIADLKEYKTVTKKRAKYSPDGRLMTPAQTYSYYTSETLSELWKRGFVMVGYASRETMNYVSGYMLKEQVLNSKGDYSITDPETGEIYERRKPYIRMSTNPGIGSEWFEKYHEDVFPSDQVIVEGKVRKAPDYYLRKLEKMNPELAQQIKEKREMAIEEQKFKEENTPERLAVKESIKKRKIGFFGTGEKL